MAHGPGRSRWLALGAIAAVILVVAIVGLALNQGGSSGATASSSPSAASSAVAVASASPSPTAKPSATPSPTPSGPRTVKIGISLPLSESWVDTTGQIRDAVLLAIKEAAPIPNVTISPWLTDHAAGAKTDEAKAVKDMRAFVADPDVVAVVGPQTSGIAYDQIPVSSEAGLLQCSATAGWPGLTKGSAAQDLRGAQTSTTFLRTITPYDTEGYAMAEFAATTLKLHRAVVVDGGTTSELRQTVDRFVERWATVPGGAVAGRLSLGSGLLAGLKSAARSHPDAVFFAGDEAGAASVRAAMAKAGLAKLPLLTNGTVAYGTGDKSYFSLAGKAAANTYSAASFQYELPNFDNFSERFRAAYGTTPDGWAPEAYACAQVVIEAIRQAATAGNLTREGVRRAATNPAMHFKTELGTISFNRAGDMVAGAITVYRANPATKKWRFAEQVSVQTP